MEYNQDKVDELTLALMYLVMSRVPGGGRALRAFDWRTMDRLHKKGLISDPKIKGISVDMSEEGVKKAEELFKKYCLER
jgi:hypothetical protein